MRHREQRRGGEALRTPHESQRHPPQRRAVGHAGQACGAGDGESVVQGRDREGGGGEEEEDRRRWNGSAVGIGAGAEDEDG